MLGPLAVFAHVQDNFSGIYPAAVKFMLSGLPVYTYQTS